MIRMLVAVLALVGLSACTPTTTTVYPENYTAANCFTGNYVFDLEVYVPDEYGRILAMTQFSNDSNGLRTVCRLVPEPNPIPGFGYPIYSGEVDNGRDGICVSARTQNAGHVLSCASQSQVRNAVRSGGTIQLTRWQPFGGS
ncbi:hypothetical protein [Gymnodinialimonas hymeniacidonis]|uniref:hypothetical protein n=1 Tax=Gymnodinialimonas hymeniacidonis TaxID=3126508 RepID=UPI0034C643A9